MSPDPVRRIVTGHDAQGRAVIHEDGPPARIQRIGGAIGPMFYEIWNTRAAPAPIDAASGEPPEEGIVLAPPAHGTRIRVLDIPPDGDNLKTLSEEESRAHFAEIGAAAAVAGGESGKRHAFMHRTETIDYGIVLEGEIVLIMDKGETTVRAGDIVVQRGTNHGWSNRTNHNCRIAFILVDGRFEGALAASPTHT
jgi:mannose-6-phosphate isomerase-like protein (cupin superfamily)